MYKRKGKQILIFLYEVGGGECGMGSTPEQKGWIKVWTKHLKSGSMDSVTGDI